MTQAMYLVMKAHSTYYIIPSWPTPERVGRLYQHPFGKLSISEAIEICKVV